MPVTGRALRLQAQIDAAVGRIVDQQVRDLTMAWIRAWDETAGDLDDAIAQLLTDSQETGVAAKALVTRNVKLAASLQFIGQRLVGLATGAGVRIVGDVHQIVQSAADAQSAILGAQLPGTYDLTGSVPGATIDAIVARTAAQITSETYPLGTDAYDAMRRELLRGMVVGANPRHTADRIMRRAEMRFNGGLARALNIATTESLDAHRAGAGAGQAAHGDVLTGWLWLAHLTPATCRSCIAMNGTLHPLSEPGPLDHQHGRCARMPKTKSWRALGVDLDEPDDIGIPDSAAWFDSLSVEEQQKILGKDGYEAWRRGEFPMHVWAERRENPGWRDSYVPAKPPPNTGGAGGVPPAAGGSGGASGTPPPGGGSGSDGPDDPFAHIPYAGFEVRHPNLSRLTNDEQEAIAYYASAGYRPINEALRGHEPMTEPVRVLADAIHEGLGKYPLPRDMRVTRSTELTDFAGRYEDLPALVGRDFTEPGFLSTSFAADHPSVMFRSKPLYLEVMLPKGTPALAIVDPLVEPGQEGEQELLVVDARQYVVVRVALDTIVQPPRWRMWIRVLGGEQ